MAICNPRYPSNISDITQLDSNGFENILSDDPTKKFNKRDLSTLNTLFNTLLNNSNLDEYPQLKERNKQGAVSDVEFADMLLDKGLTLDFIKNGFIEDFPVELDYESVKNLVGQTEDAINEQIRRASEQNNTGIPTSTLGDFGTLSNVLGNKPPTNEGIAGGSFGTGLFNDGKFTGRVRAGGDVSTSTGAGTTGTLGSNTSAILSDATPTTDGTETPFINNGITITDSDISVVESLPIVTNQNTSWNPGSKITDIFNLAEDYYRQSFSGNNNGIAANFNKNACGGFSNPFGKLISLIGAIASARNLATQTLSQLPSIGSITDQFSDIQNLFGQAGGLIGSLSGSISNLVNDIKEYGDLSGIIQGLSSQLGNFQQQLLDLPNQIKNSMLSQINGLQQTAQSFFSQNIGSSKGLFKFVNKKIQKTKEFFSKNIIDSIKEKVNKFFDQNTQQFEDLLPDVLNFLLLKACGLANLLESLMRAPVDRLKELISSVTGTHDVMTSTSAQARNNVLENGAIRITPTQRKKEAQKGVENWNNSKGYTIPNDFTQPSSYVKPAITPEELNEVSRNINGDGLSGSFYFIRRNVSEMGKRAKEKYEASKDNPGAYGRVYGKLHTEVWDPSQNFHDAEADVDMGWKFIVDNNPTLWIMLHRVAQRLKNQGYLSSSGLQVNSAFRSPYYNYFLTGGAKASNHMKGMALDIGKATIGSDEQQAAFIRACSDEGFIRIVAYASFFHIDVGPGVKSSHWTSKSNLGTLARSAWETHAST